MNECQIVYLGKLSERLRQLVDEIDTICEKISYMHHLQTTKEKIESKETENV